jgi:hypothetical protein
MPLSHLLRQGGFRVWLLPQPHGFEGSDLVCICAEFWHLRCQ